MRNDALSLGSSALNELALKSFTFIHLRIRLIQFRRGFLKVLYSGVFELAQERIEK